VRRDKLAQGRTIDTNQGAAAHRQPRFFAATLSTDTPRLPGKFALAVVPRTGPLSISKVPPYRSRKIVATDRPRHEPDLVRMPRQNYAVGIFTR
jgi:hypothetical protein